MMTTMPSAILMITTTNMTTMTTMMLSKYLSAAMILCANHAGTSAIVRIAITNVQTTIAPTATSKGTPKDFARMCSVRIAIFLVT
jgi:hypothetical protein